MPTGLRRIWGGGDWHFITPGSPDPRFAGWGGCSCYRRQPFLVSARERDVFLKILEEVVIKYQFTIAGYVVMPEHFHLLVSEPAVGSPPLAMQVLKQRVSRRSRRKKKTPGQLPFWKEEEREQPPAFWQKRHYDFNVYTERKYIEKLRYMHRNPVKRGLVTAPELWRWSSFRHYWFGEKGPVKVG